MNFCLESQDITYWGPYTKLIYQIKAYLKTCKYKVKSPSENSLQCALRGSLSLPLGHVPVNLFDVGFAAHFPDLMSYLHTSRFCRSDQTIRT